MTASVNQRVQWRWTGDTTTHAFTSLTANANIKVETDVVRPAGDRFAASTYLKKEWSEGSIEGVVDYHEVGPLLEWAMAAGTPTEDGDTTTTPYTVAPGRTRTLEVGDDSSAVLVQNCFLTGISFDFGRSAGDCSVKADMVGGQWADGATMTANPVRPTALPATAGHVTVTIAESRAGLDMAAPASQVLKATVSLNSLRDPLWLLNGASSISGSTEKAVDGTVELLMVSDAAGRAWLQRLRSGDTRYVRVDVNAGDGDHRITMDFAVQAADHSREDADAVYAAKTVLNIVRDSTGFSHELRVTIPTTEAE